MLVLSGIGACFALSVGRKLGQLDANDFEEPRRCPLQVVQGQCLTLGVVGTYP